jgi:hypothetical protein
MPIILDMIVIVLMDVGNMSIEIFIRIAARSRTARFLIASTTADMNGSNMN